MTTLRLPKLKSSLCGCSLETGCKIIAYVHLIPVCIGSLLEFSGSVVVNMSWYDNEQHPINAGYFKIVFMRDGEIFSNLLLTIIFSGHFLFAIYKRYNLHIWPFLTLKCIHILMYLINIMGFIIARVQGEKHLYIFALLAGAGLESYMFTIVYSFLLQLENRPQHSQIS